MPGRILERTQRVQLGLEGWGAAGTEVTPTRQIDGLNFTSRMKIETEETQSSGNWPATLQTTGEDSSEGSYEQPSLDFNVYPLVLASVMRGDDGAGAAMTPTALGANGAQEWVYYMDPSNPNVGQTYTLEQGDNIRGQKTTGVIFSSHTLNVQPKTAKGSGNWLGGQLRDTSDGLTPAFTAIQTALARLAGGQVPISAKNFCLYMSTTSRDALNVTPGDFQSGSDPANRLPTGLDFSWMLGGRRENMYAIRCDLNGAPVATVEGMELSAGSVEHEADNEIMILTQNARGVAAQRMVWFRLEAYGPTIGAGPERYRFMVDFAAFIKGPEAFKANGKVKAVKFPLVYALDADFGGAGVAGFLETRVVNTQTSLLA
jgi:hypothetical protein